MKTQPDSPVLDRIEAENIVLRSYFEASGMLLNASNPLSVRDVL